MEKDSLKLGGLIEWAAKELADCVDNPIGETRYLIEGVLKFERSEQYIENDREISRSELEAFGCALERRKKAEPLAMILGYKEFYGREFEVSRDTLIPRDDSEVLVDVVLGYCRKLGVPDVIIDLGTGSGCLLISILCETKIAEAIAIDKSFSALMVAKSNAERHGVSDRISWREQDWQEDIELYKREVMIISNPPYVKSGDMRGLETHDYEPHLALDGGYDGLRSIREILSRRTRWGSRETLFMEVGVGQAEQVMEEAGRYSWEFLEKCCDLSGLDRLIVCQISDKRVG